MTAKSTKTQEPTDEATVSAKATETTPATSGTKPGTGRAKGKSGKSPAKTPKSRQAATVADGKAKAERKPRPDTKQAQLIAMLNAKDGATVEEIAAAFGWQAHTVRGALYGALKKKLGFDVVSEKVEAAVASTASATDPPTARCSPPSSTGRRLFVAPELSAATPLPPRPGSGPFL